MLSKFYELPKLIFNNFTILSTNLVDCKLLWENVGWNPLNKEGKTYYSIPFHWNEPYSHYREFTTSNDLSFRKKFTSGVISKIHLLVSCRGLITMSNTWLSRRYTPNTFHGKNIALILHLLLWLCAILSKLIK